MQNVFLLLLFCLPFELPIVEASHGLLYDRIGYLYLFASVGAVLCMVSLLVALSVQKSEAHRVYTPIGLVYCFIGLLGVPVTLFACVDLEYSLHVRVAVQQFVFGYLMPFLVCFAILGLPPAEKQRAWRWFYGGFVVYLALSLIPLVMTYRSATSEIQGFADFSMAERMVRGRGVFDNWNYYLIYIGNTNKTSNYLLISLLFSVRLLGNLTAAAPQVQRMSRRLLLAFWFLGSCTLLILLSRLALMLFPIVLVASGVLKQLAWRTKVATISVLVAALGYSQFGVLADYVLNSALPGEDGMGFFGTGTLRLDQWGDICDYCGRNPQQVIFGLGVGAYGELFFQNHERGTHNLFLDVLLESGILGLAALMLVLVLTAAATIHFRSLRFRDSLSATALALLVLLMIREHSPAYLFVTSLGGFCFTMAFYAAAERAAGATVQTAWRPTIRRQRVANAVRCLPQA